MIPVDRGTRHWQAARNHRRGGRRGPVAAGLTPYGVTWTALHGCAWLGGIGFTMSLFIATLAFDGTGLLDSAKIGVLAASTFAGVVGALVVRRGLQQVAASDGVEGRLAATRP